jgi:competence protein ComEC
MNVITVNVGQGALSIVRHNGEAIVVDSRIPPSGDGTVSFVKQMFASSLRNHAVRGFILTGLDSDHCDLVGAAIVLQKYRPNWVMYPRCYKDSDEARLVFGLIDEQVEERLGSANPLRKISVRLDKLTSRKLPGLSTNFDFELFSPHVEDMNSSNNCSIVLKLTGTGPRGFSYLITGDTERERWCSIEEFFRGSLKSHVMAASHHGSSNGVHPASLLHIAPHTVLISAGVDSQYGHPDPAAMKVYRSVAKYVYSTSMQGGVTLLTQPGTSELTTTLIPC